MSTCRICSQELTIELDPESFDEATSSSVCQSSTAPDDLFLICGCHFHWQCLLDESPEVAISLACPACGNSIVTGPSGTFQEPRVLTRYQNEGGLQENLDILPLIAEEAYLDANPAARPARAFMTMCGEGDITGIVELLKAIQEDPDERDLSPTELLRFRDPLDGGKTGLHLAVEKGQQEAVWLLLWLASGLPTERFPDEVRQATAVLEAERGTAEGIDIRTLKDEQHQTPQDIAGNMGSTWVALIGAEILRG